MKADLDVLQFMRGLSPSGLQLLSTVLGWQCIWHTVSLDNRDNRAQWHSTLCSSRGFCDSVLDTGTQKNYILGLRNKAQFDSMCLICMRLGLVHYTCNTHQGAEHKGWQNAQPSVENIHCTPFSKGSGNIAEEEAESVSEPVAVDGNKWCLLETAVQLCTWIHIGCNTIHKICASLRQTGTQHGGTGQDIPSFTLDTTVSYWERKGQFSLKV